MKVVLKEFVDALIRWLSKRQIDEVEWLPADITIIEEIRRLL